MKYPVCTKYAVHSTMLTLTVLLLDAVAQSSDQSLSRSSHMPLSSFLVPEVLLS